MIEDFDSNPYFLSAGLVSRVFPMEKVVDEALATAQEISRYSWPVVSMCKEAVNKGIISSSNAGSVPFM